MYVAGSLNSKTRAHIHRLETIDHEDRPNAHTPGALPPENASHNSSLGSSHIHLQVPAPGSRRPCRSSSDCAKARCFSVFFDGPRRRLPTAQRYRYELGTTVAVICCIDKQCRFGFCQLLSTSRSLVLSETAFGWRLQRRGASPTPRRHHHRRGLRSSYPTSYRRCSRPPAGQGFTRGAFPHPEPEDQLRTTLDKVPFTLRRPLWALWCVSCGDSPVIHTVTKFKAMQVILHGPLRRLAKQTCT